MRKLFARELTNKVALVIAGILTGLVICELILRVLLPCPSGYYTWPPNLQKTFRPNSWIMPNIIGESRFLVNSNGLRADEFPLFPAYKIIVIGGSTTECLYLDQREAWPYLLQEKLSGNKHHYKVWVGNMGKGGLNSRHHILQMQYLLQEYRNIDAVIMLVGVNDMSLALGESPQHDHDLLRPSAYRAKLLDAAFSVSPLPKNKGPLPFYKRTVIWDLIERAEGAFLEKKDRFGSSARIMMDVTGQWLVKERENRFAAHIRNTLPDPYPALKEYRHNINTIIDLAKKRHLRLIFITQPTLWKPGLPNGLNRLLWGGFTEEGPQYRRQYYSVEVLAAVMNLYNEALVDICKMRGVEYFDLAENLTQDDSVFYDDCHFNEPGARKVAELLAGYLLDRPPFN